MKPEWYPKDKEKLEKDLEKYLSEDFEGNVNGLIVPHAGFEFSGDVAGKAFSALKGRENETIVVIGPNHYSDFEGVRVLENLETPLGKVEVPENNFEKTGYEHSVENEIPFLQKLGFKNILPLVVGKIDLDDAEKLAVKVLEIGDVFVFSSDLSHFLNYEKAKEKDRKSIEIIEDLNFDNIDKVDACGVNGLKILFWMCKKQEWKPELIEYKNSGDVAGDRERVVGYASFWF